MRATLILALCMFAQSTSAADDWYKPTVGKPHADFILPRIDNREPVSLSQYRGRKVVLIHFASW